MTLQEPPDNPRAGAPDERRLEVVREPPPDYDDTDRHNTPPTDIPAEKALLTALLLQPAHAPQLATELTGADFYQPRHEAIWHALQTATADGCTDLTLTRQTIANTLISNGGARHASYLLELATGDGDPLYIPAYVKVIRNNARLRAVATAARAVLGQAEKGDLDKVDQTLGELVDITADAAMRFDAGTQDEPPTGERDLSWLKDGIFPAIDPPIYCQRTDGHALFYAGRVNGVFGDPESAKTWLAQVACIEAMNAGRFVAMVDVDHNGQELNAARMLLLGARPSQLADPTLYRYFEPDDGRELRNAVTKICTLKPAVVVLDSIGEMMPMLNVKSVDNDELTAALRAIASPPARAGACVITIDHLPKSHEARTSGFAIGGTAKKRAIDGSYINAQTVVQPVQGIIGKVNLYIEKDRPGELRKTCTGKYVGQFTLDSTIPTMAKASIGASSAITDDGVFRPTHLMEIVSRLVEDKPRIITGDIEKSIHSKAPHVRAAIQRLLEETYMIAEKGAKNRTHHTSVKPFREVEDELF